MSTRAHRQSGGVYGQRGVAVRLAYLLGACAAWCVTLGGRLGRRRGVVLCYHGVSDRHREAFARQVGIAARRAATLTQVVQGRRGSVCFTFDDAFANLLRHGLPVMARTGTPSVIFAVSGNLGTAPKWEMRPGHPERDERIMTEAELREAEHFVGCQVQSHSATHRALGRLSDAEVMDELARSRTALEAILGHEVDEIAAPFGSWSGAVAKAARSAGYKRLLTLDPNDTWATVKNGTAESPRVIGRYLMSPETWAIEFRLTIDGAYAWVFAARRLAGRARRLWSRAGERASTGAGSVVGSST